MNSNNDLKANVNYNLSPDNFNGSERLNRGVIEGVDAQTNALIQAHRPLIRRLFPNKIDRLIDELKLNTIRANMDFKLELYRLHTEFALDGTKELFNSRLKIVKSEYRERVSAFMMSKLEQLNNDVSLRQISFMELIKKKYFYLASIENLPLLHDTYNKAIEQEIVNHFAFLENLILKFQAIINEELKRY